MVAKLNSPAQAESRLGEHLCKGLHGSGGIVLSPHRLADREEVRAGIDQDRAKEIVRLLKQSGLKVQPAIQADQVRVRGKNKDDLQAVIKLLRERDLGIAMQFSNFRD